MPAHNSKQCMASLLTLAIWQELEFSYFPSSNSSHPFSSCYGSTNIRIDLQAMTPPSETPAGADKSMHSDGGTQCGIEHHHQAAPGGYPQGQVRVGEGGRVTQSLGQREERKPTGISQSHRENASEPPDGRPAALFSLSLPVNRPSPPSRAGGRQRRGVGLGRPPQPPRAMVLPLPDLTGQCASRASNQMQDGAIDSDSLLSLFFFS